ncbi:MAG: SIR2 family protein [Vicinamibacterales bacterium]
MKPAEALRHELTARRVVPVIGAGVSVQVAGLPSWRGAIDAALQHAIDTGTAGPRERSEVDALIGAQDLVGAAHHVKQILGAPGGEYPAWLRETFGRAHRAPQMDLVDAIGDLLCDLVATTNYDRLLSELLIDHPIAVTWRQPIEMGAALRSAGHALHLHGVFSDPESVIFGADNYNELASAAGYRAVLQSLWLERTLLFIGCSFGGLRDPDFTHLLDWAATTFTGASWKHYALIFEGEVTPDLVREFLHRWRIQVVPFGPGYADLAATIRQLNPHADQALAHRVLVIEQILRSTPADARNRVIDLLGGLPMWDRVTGTPTVDVGPSLLDIADALLATERRTQAQMRGDVKTMQALASSMLDRRQLERGIGYTWREGVKLLGDAFRPAVLAASAALTLFPDSLLAALKRRGVAIHGNYLSGYCRSVLEGVEKGDTWPTEDHYTLENLYRILTSLNAVLGADADELFPDPQAGTRVSPSELPALVVLRTDRLELRRLDAADTVIAQLPLNPSTSPSGAEVVRFEGEDAICAFDREQVFIWPPCRTGSVVANFKVGEAYGISGVAHETADADGAPLSSLVTTFDGPIYELANLHEVRTFAPIKGVLSSPIVVNRRLYVLVDSRTEIARIDLRQASPRGAPWVYDGWVLRTLPTLPGVQAALDARRAADRAHYGDLDDDESDERRLLQHPELALCLLDGRPTLALSVALHFATSTASLVLFLDAEADRPTVVGHFFRDETSTSDLVLLDGEDGRARMVYVLLSDFEDGYDLVRWARATPTSRGVVFVDEGSALRTRDDLIHVAVAGDGRGFAADDSGGLFRFSLRDGAYAEVERDRGSRIRALLQYPGESALRG